MASALSAGVVAVSHASGAASMLLDGFDRSEVVDVIGRKGARLHRFLGTTLHYTRRIDEHVTTVGPIPVLTIAATLAPRTRGRDPTNGSRSTACCARRARRGASQVASAWRRRCRSARRRC